MTAAEKLGSCADFEAFPRMCEPERYRSATELRRLIYSGGTEKALAFIPEALHDVYPFEAQVSDDKLAELLYNYYRLRGETDGRVFFEGEGGVDARLLKAASESAGHSEFFSKAATKRYTDSRLRRAALFALLGVMKDDVTRTPSVTVLLAASKKGREYLSSLRKAEGIRILTKPSDTAGLSEESVRQISLMRRADELYTLCLKEKTPAGKYLRKRPYIE
jgi:predicted nucleotidyltransferase